MVYVPRSFGTGSSPEPVDRLTPVLTAITDQLSAAAQQLTEAAGQLGVRPAALAEPTVRLADRSVTLAPETLQRLEALLAKAAPTGPTRIVSGGGSGAAKLPDFTGTWGYTAGIDGTVTVTGGKRVLQITATSEGGGTVVVDGGDPITIPAAGSLTVEPKAQLVDPTVTFTATTAYFIEHLEG